MTSPQDHIRQLDNHSLVARATELLSQDVLPADLAARLEAGTKRLDARISEEPDDLRGASQPRATVVEVLIDAVSAAQDAQGREVRTRAQKRVLDIVQAEPSPDTKSRKRMVVGRARSR